MRFPPRHEGQVHHEVFIPPAVVESPIPVVDQLDPGEVSGGEDSSDEGSSDILPVSPEKRKRRRKSNKKQKRKSKAKHNHRET